MAENKHHKNFGTIETPFDFLLVNRVVVKTTIIWSYIKLNLNLDRSSVQKKKSYIQEHMSFHYHKNLDPSTVCFSVGKSYEAFLVFYC